MTVRPLHEIEREAIISALVAFKGDKPAAATALGITLKTVYNRLHQYGLPLNLGRDVVNVSVDAVST